MPLPLRGVAPFTLPKTRIKILGSNFVKPSFGGLTDDLFIQVFGLGEICAGNHNGDLAVL